MDEETEVQAREMVQVLSKLVADPEIESRSLY